MPRKGVIESELEISQEERSYYGPYGQNREAVSRLPFVRIFSLDTKSYAYADVDDVMAYEFDTSAMSKLHLPEEMISILTRVFNTPVSGLFGDLIKGKHGGVVILASGSPGVGKTLTAEVYAEQTQRPLYVLELGELGTNVATVEENLNRVFTRVARWNAVLQFDECEIFLAQRGDDLERSAIVGGFLRLLDYYQGILFLTTNRPEVLDHAVLSRVMLKLSYPDLDLTARTVIWGTMLASAGLTLIEGTVEELAHNNINGRQIRNLTRLAKILHPSGQVTLEQMRGVLRYGCA
jgi:SpoVK/Ycf46/Vps4 family AAA+-type ATPase